MRAARRRSRTMDPLAAPSAVRMICEKFRERFPESIPASDKGLMRFLYAVRHVDRWPITDSQRGRPRRWPREELIKAAGHLRNILECETQGRVSLNSFIGQYLPILKFPSDVTDALISGQITLQEAAQLARLTPERIGCSRKEAIASREEILRDHLALQGSQTRLRARVKEFLGENLSKAVSSESMTAVVTRVDELLVINPHDTRHLFWEEMKHIFYAIREIELDDLDEATMNEFMGAMDHVSNVLFRIQKRRRRREQK